MPKDNVIIAPIITKLSLSPERVLLTARDKLEKVLLIGIDKDGDPYYATSVGEEEGGVAEVNMMVDKFKKFLMDMYT